MTFLRIACITWAIGTGALASRRSAEQTTSESEVKFKEMPDRHHDSNCFWGGGCNVDESVCEWCGIHQGSAMHCCNRCVTYAPDQPCFGADFPDKDGDHCVVPQAETPDRHHDTPD